MTVGNFSELIGSEEFDDLVGSNLNIVYGLQGDDILASLPGSSGSLTTTILVGGLGNDSYQINNNSLNIIIENGNDNNDQIQTNGISIDINNLDSLLFAQVDNDRHLYLGDTGTNQYVLLIDWQDSDKSIENFISVDTTLTISEVAENIELVESLIGTGLVNIPGYLGSLTWEETIAQTNLDLSRLGLSTETIDTAIEQIKTRSQTLIDDNTGSVTVRNFNLGFLTLNQVPIERGNVLENNVFDNDIYRFEVIRTVDLEISLEIISDNDDADLALYRDRNNNGQLDASDELLDNSSDFGDDLINFDGAFANTYFADVTYFDGGNNDSLNYNLSISAQANPNTTNSSIFDIPFSRFQNSNVPGTYLYAGGAEANNIRANFPSFVEEGIAFNAAIVPSDGLIPLFRFQSNQLPGTYLFVGEEERNSINADPNFSSSFTEEGIAFHVYGAGTNQATPLSRFQNLNVPGTYLYAGGFEAANIRANFSNSFIDEGIAFEVGT